MSHKIIVADDSLTVQKVVSITLASYDYELVECRDETQLNEQLMVGGVNLLLLDLNLSEGKSGYEVAKAVHEKHPKLPIILLLGTFDSVDEAAFGEAGFSDRIVKPFESNSFTQKVQSLLENSTASEADSSSAIFSGETESNFLSSDLEDVTPESELTIDSGDDWVVDSPSPEDKSSEEFDSFSLSETENKENALEASLEGWGMNVPGQIGSSDTETDMALPGVIADSITEETVAEAVAELDIVHEEQKSLPEESDLDYPDVGEPENREQSAFEEVDQLPTSALLPNDDFNLDVSEEKADLASVVESEEEGDDFWAADDADSTTVEVSISDEIEAEEETEEYHAEPDEEASKEIVEDSFTLEPLGDPRGNEPFEIKSEERPSINSEEIVNKILEELKPTLNELVEKHCKETIENVAWQIIPDLAENLIRSEIKTIKESSSST